MENEETNSPERKPCPECGKDFTWVADGSRPRAHKCVPQEQEAPKPVGVITPDMVIEAYIKTREEIAEREKGIKELKAKQTKKEEWLAANMDAAGETGKKTNHGSCHFRTTASVKTADWEAFRAWQKEDPEDREHFLDRKVSKAAVTHYLEETNTLPPGVDYTTVRKVSVTRPK